MQTFAVRTTYAKLTTILLLVCGCSQLEINKSLRWERKEEDPKAARILAIWSDTILNTAGKPAMRGFGGRIFFYGEKEGNPIEVDGAVLVYAFDAEKIDKTSVAPEKKYVFPAENLASHYSKCSLGHSYSFWLPWDKVGGKTRQVSLIVRFEGADGTVVLSDSSRKLLPGVSSALTETESAEPDSLPQVAIPAITRTTEKVQQVGFNSVEATDLNRINAAMESAASDTIALTPSMSKRLMRPDNAQQHQTANQQHTQAMTSIQHLSASENSRGTVAYPARPVAGKTIPLDDGRRALQDDSTSAIATPREETSLAGPPTAAAVVPTRPLPAVDYQPTLSQAPFASTAQRIVGGRRSRQNLGLPQFGRPLVQRPGPSPARENAEVER